MHHDPLEGLGLGRRRGARGLLAHQQPLNPNLSVAGELPHDLRLVMAREQARTACRCVVANALLAQWQGESTWVFYSRDNTHYAAVRAGVPFWYSRSAVAWAVDQLVARGLLEEKRTAPSPSARFRSSFRATGNLIQAIGPVDISHLRWTTTHPVILHSRDDRRTLDPVAVLTDLELAELADIGIDVEAHNAFMSAFDIRLHPDAVEVLPSGLLKVGNVCLNPALRRQHRVFNGDLQHGGRWYGSWWQTVPAAARPHLLIDGQPTVELDFAACQLRLMFAWLGLTDPLDGAIRNPAFDLYAIDGFARDDVKLALLMMINARNLVAARGALAAELTCDPATRRREASHILRAVQQRFPELEQLWCSGLGLRLQRADSDICTMIHRKMRAQGLPVLSVHDGFISWKHAEPQLRSIMLEAFQSAWKGL